MIGLILRWIFTYVFYPIVIIGIFLFMIILIVNFIAESSGSNRFRIVTASLLPLLLLIFFLLMPDQSDESMHFFFSVNPLYHLFVGGIFGILLVEIGRYIDNYVPEAPEIGKCVYVLFLSSAAAFILYSIMQGILDRLHWFLLGMVFTAGIDIIFKGPPFYNFLTREPGTSDDSQV